MVKEIIDESIKEKVATDILQDLPEWFGIPEYTKDYIEKSKNMPFFAKYVEEIPVGFISLKETSRYTAEIFCMGVQKLHQHCGFGKELFDAVERYARSKNYKFIQVKTVEQGKYESYDLTNAFYKSMGFYELEVFPSLWDAWNPCQVLVKAI